MDFLTILVLTSWTLSPSSAQQDRFSEQLESVLQRVRFPAEKMKVVPRLVEDLERVLQPRWPGCQAVPYGSIVTGLALVTSDVDCIVIFPNQTKEVSAKQLVSEIHDIIQRRPDLFQEIRPILTAFVPIVTGNHLRTGLKVDISSKHNGVANSYLLRYLLNLDERAIKLAMVIKYWAKLNGIIKTRVFSSFSIVQMVIFFLQQREILPPVAYLQKNANSFFVDNWNMGFRQVKYETKNNESMCALLNNFFKYYYNFDYSNYIISAFAGRPLDVNLFKKESTVPDIFQVYKMNVGLNIITPIDIKKANIQCTFDHGRNLARRLDVSSNSTFMALFNYAAMKCTDNCKSFLNDLVL